ncbi:MAG: ABC transporter permease, partial [Saprospiraceae bacterium]|nr:ABC transporter permease [Saprospiraceae bacterium]
MIRNYLKVAWRSLVKGRLYSLINILGLSVGVAVCLLILLFVRNETSFDKFHHDADRIYRAWVKEQFKDQLLFNSVTPVVLGPELRDNFPGVESVARYVSNTTSARVGAFLEQESVMMADPEFLEVFDFEMLAGTRVNAFSEIHNVVITPSL